MGTHLRHLIAVASALVVTAPMAAAVASSAAPAASGPTTQPRHEVGRHVDARGHVYYVDPATALAPASVSPPARTPYPLDQTFSLHSLPGSTHTIFLDFDGSEVSGTDWNAQGLPDGLQPGWTIDSDLSSFNDEERAVIQGTWQRVAEDFAPFDVDVTTQDPGLAALDRSGPADLVFGTRALVTVSEQTAATLCGGCAGVAYLDAFDLDNRHAARQPAWIFTNGAGGWDVGLSATISHEVGHNFGLHHDGEGTHEYYAGNELWGPIMGVSSRPVKTWSMGSYPGATNLEDDLAVIASHGAPLRPDETTTTVPSGPAYITTRADTETYDLPACAQATSVTARPAPNGPNLDIRLDLLSTGGDPVASADPPIDVNSFDQSVQGLAATVSTAAPGTYRVRVDGVGYGDAATGYDDYASLGAYTLQVTCGRQATIPSAPAGLSGSAVPGERRATLTWSAPADDGNREVTAYQVFSNGDQLATLPASARTYEAAHLTLGYTYHFAVRAVNVVGVGDIAEVAVPVGGGVPDAPLLKPAVSGVPGGKATATAKWAQPKSDGGSPVTGFAVTAYKLDRAGDVVKQVRSAMLPPTKQTLRMVLAKGRWQFAVTAYNAAGASPLSARSNIVRAR